MPAFEVEDEEPRTLGRRRLRSKQMDRSSGGADGVVMAVSNGMIFESDGSPRSDRRSSLPALTRFWSNWGSFNPFRTKFRREARERPDPLKMGVEPARDSIVWVDGDAFHGPVTARRPSARPNGGGGLSGGMDEKMESWPGNDIRMPTLPVTNELLKGPKTAMVASYGVRVPPSRGGKRLGGGSSIERTSMARGPRVYVSPDSTARVIQKPFRTREQLSGDHGGLNFSQILTRTEIKLVADDGQGLDSPEKLAAPEQITNPQQVTHNRQGSSKAEPSEDSTTYGAKNEASNQLGTQDTSTGLASPSCAAEVGLGARDLPGPTESQQNMGRNNSDSSRSSGLSTVYSVGDEVCEDVEPVDSTKAKSLVKGGGLSKHHAHILTAITQATQIPDPFIRSHSSSPPKLTPSWPVRRGLSISNGRKRPRTLGNDASNSSPTREKSAKPDSASCQIHSDQGSRDTATVAGASAVGSPPSPVKKIPNIVSPGSATETPGLPWVMATPPSGVVPSFVKSPDIAVHALGGSNATVEVDLKTLTRQAEEEMAQEQYWQMERERERHENSETKKHARGASLKSSPSGPPPNLPLPSIPATPSIEKYAGAGAGAVVWPGMRVVDRTPTSLLPLAMGDTNCDNINAVRWELDGKMLSFDGVEGWDWISQSTPARRGHATSVTSSMKQGLGDGTATCGMATSTGEKQKVEMDWKSGGGNAQACFCRLSQERNALPAPMAVDHLESCAPCGDGPAQVADAPAVGEVQKWEELGRAPVAERSKRILELPPAATPLAAVDGGSAVKPGSCCSSRPLSSSNKTSDLGLAVADPGRINSMVSNHNAVSWTFAAVECASPRLPDLRGRGFGGGVSNEAGNMNDFSLDKESRHGWNYKPRAMRMRARRLSVGEVLLVGDDRGDKENNDLGGGEKEEAEEGSPRRTADEGIKGMGIGEWQRRSEDSLYDEDGFLKTSPR